MLESARAENATTKRARSSLERTKKILFTSPSSTRRSPRFQQTAEAITEVATEAGDKSTERFVAGLLKSCVGSSTVEKEVRSPPLTKRHIPKPSEVAKSTWLYVAAANARAQSHSGNQSAVFSRAPVRFYSIFFNCSFVV